MPRDQILALVGQLDIDDEAALTVCAKNLK
ncbi:MAG: hypothetical protein JNL46_02140 [Sphingosinicella sp.]|nr:hypothetical protein [Sphingosinicella sp.]